MDGEAASRQPLARDLIVGCATLGTRHVLYYPLPRLVFAHASSALRLALRVGVSKEGVHGYPFVGQAPWVHLNWQSFLAKHAFE